MRPIAHTMLSLIILGSASISSADTLTVTIENTKIAEGALMLRILQGETEFKGEHEAIISIQQRAIAGSSTFTVSNLPAGEYAVQVMQDLNRNGKLDSNFIGLPTEPWAFSNNATGNMGPPGWQDVKFNLDGNATQSIRLIH